MPFVYLLRCVDGTLYVGHTYDLATREKTHNDGHGSTYTESRRPVEMVYAEEHCSLQSAIARERQVKRWTAKKKEMLVTGDFPTLKALSRTNGRCVAFTWRDWLKGRS